MATSYSLLVCELSHSLIIVSNQGPILYHVSQNNNKIIMIFYFEVRQVVYLYDNIIKQPMGTHYQLLLGIRDERTRAPSLLLVSVDPSGLLSFSGESEDSNDPSRLDQCAIRDSCAGLPSLCYAVSFSGL